MKLKDVTPRWGWDGKSEADEQASMKASSNALLAWAEAMSGKPKAKGIRVK